MNQAVKQTKVFNLSLFIALSWPLVLIYSAACSSAAYHSHSPRSISLVSLMLEGWPPGELGSQNLLLTDNQRVKGGERSHSDVSLCCVLHLVITLVMLCFEARRSLTSYLRGQTCCDMRKPQQLCASSSCYTIFTHVIR